MKVGVACLWRVGSVMAACLAQASLDVVRVDDASVVAGLAAGRAPLFEPGLDDLIAADLASGHLRLSAEPAAVLRDVDIVWITYDTPVDDDDRTDVEVVISRATALLPLLPVGALVLVSSQLPIGTPRRIWASPRELLNIVQANLVGCQIITATHDILKKLPTLGCDLDAYSLDTVKMFRSDAVAAGFRI